MLEIPIIPEALDDGFSSELGDEKFHFRFWWAEEVESCFLDLRGLTNDFDLKGHMLSPGHNIFGPYAARYGHLVITGPEHELVSFKSLGTTHKMLWASRDEIDA